MLPQLWLSGRNFVPACLIRPLATKSACRLQVGSEG